MFAERECKFRKAKSAAHSNDRADLLRQFDKSLGCNPYSFKKSRSDDFIVARCFSCG